MAAGDRRQLADRLRRAAGRDDVVERRRRTPRPATRRRGRRPCRQSRQLVAVEQEAVAGRGDERGLHVVGRRRGRWGTGTRSPVGGIAVTAARRCPEPTFSCWSPVVELVAALVDRVVAPAEAVERLARPRRAKLSSHRRDAASDRSGGGRPGACRPSPGATVAISRPAGGVGGREHEPHAAAGGSAPTHLPRAVDGAADGDRRQRPLPLPAGGLA